MTAEDQIRARLDGTFIAFHFSGRLIPMVVPLDFNPFIKEGQSLIRKRIEQKVFTA